MLGTPFITCRDSIGPTRPTEPSGNSFQGCPGFAQSHKQELSTRSSQEVSYGREHQVSSPHPGIPSWDCESRSAALGDKGQEKSGDGGSRAEKIRLLSSLDCFPVSLFLCLFVHLFVLIKQNRWSKSNKAKGLAT